MSQVEKPKKEKKEKEVSPYKLLHKAENITRKINLRNKKVKRAMDEVAEMEKSLNELLKPIQNTEEYKLWKQAQEAKKAGSKS